MNSLFDSIEDVRARASVTVASDVETFVRGLESLSGVRELTRAARSDGTACAAIINRLAELVERRIDSRFENPHDVAMASYVFILSRVAPNLLEVATDQIARAENTWWAKRLIDRWRALGADVSVGTSHVTIGRPAVALDVTRVTDATIRARVFSVPVPVFTTASFSLGWADDGENVETAFGNVTRTDISSITATSSYVAA